MTAFFEWLAIAAIIILGLIFLPWLIAIMIKNPNYWLFVVPLAFIIYHGLVAPDRGRQ